MDSQIPSVLTRSAGHSQRPPCAASSPQTPVGWRGMLVAHSTPYSPCSLYRRTRPRSYVCLQHPTHGPIPVCLLFRSHPLRACARPLPPALYHFLAVVSASACLDDQCWFVVLSISPLFGHPPDVCRGSTCIASFFPYP